MMELPPEFSGDDWDEVLGKNGLSVRVINGIANSGRINPRDFSPQAVAAISETDLRRMPNFGEKSLRELKEWLSEYGLCPRADSPIKSDAIKRLNEAIECGKGDPEAGHSLADDVLCDFLRSLGHDDVVDLWLKVDKWYA